MRYADDFVILARKLQGRFVQEIERELEGRFGLVGVRFFLVEPKSCFHAGDFVALRVWQCHLRNVSTPQFVKWEVYREGERVADGLSFTVYRTGGGVPV